MGAITFVLFPFYEAMRRLQWESFFTQNEDTQYTISIEVIKSLKEAVAEKYKKVSSTKKEDWMEKCEPTGSPEQTSTP